MRVFLYHLEELYNDSRNGFAGSTAAAFRDTEALSGSIVYRYRSGAFSFKYTIPESSLDSSHKKPVVEEIVAQFYREAPFAKHFQNLPKPKVMQER